MRGYFGNNNEIEIQNTEEISMVDKQMIIMKSDTGAGGS